LRCAALAAYLGPFNIHRLYASYERKAQETAGLVARKLGIEVETCPNVHEHVRSTSILLPQQAFRERLQTFFQQPGSLVFGKETAASALARFSSAIDQLLMANTDCDVALTTHGTVMTLFVCAHSEWEPFAFWNRLGQPSVVIFDAETRSLAQTAFTV
jgi:broad specificity phosphatase PhoE